MSYCRRKKIIFLNYRQKLNEKENLEKHFDRSKNNAENTKNEVTDLDINEIELARHQITRDKIIRFIGQDNHAGFERAKEWAKSPYTYLRQNAIVVFGDIKDDESISQVHMLALANNIRQRITRACSIDG